MADRGTYGQYKEDVHKLIERCKQWAAEYKAEEKTDDTSNPSKTYIWRNAATQDSLKDPYFGFIRPEEPFSGRYSDFSLVVFTSPRKIHDKAYALGPVVVALGVGTNGFTNDGELAVQPGVRRLFRKILNPAFGDLKNNMSDIEKPAALKSDVSKKITSRYAEYIQQTADSLDTQPRNYDDLDIVLNTITGNNYARCIQAWQFIPDPFNDEGHNTLHAFIAAYARLRGWGSIQANNKANPLTYLSQYNADTRSTKETGSSGGTGTIATTSQTTTSATNNDEKNIMHLLRERHFVVLQGAPGTGKTRMATQVIAPELVTTVTPDNVIFTQFHAETTYSDFIYGIRPVLNSHDTTPSNPDPSAPNPHGSRANDLGYEGYEGPLVTAIRAAQRTPDKPVLLIIDEINRANLPNVLGQAFYLFERNTNTTRAKTENRPALEVAPGLRLSSLPDNLYVIATMNTADRSIAVVDFALRRRFAWYTLRPTIPDGVRTTSLGKKKQKKPDGSDCFYTDVFDFFADTFDWYANDEELSLQPGQGYFFARNDDEMRDRLRYELMPLIKEYLTEGYLKDAADTFSSYFRQATGEELYA